jgi:crotonobetainyl-CoA:carnitine CoA-transferase CaiB-like acyl-CoA transferase
VDKLQHIQIPTGVINNVKEAFDLATSLGLSPVVEIEGVKSVANPIKFSKTPVQYKSAPPKLAD